MTTSITKIKCPRCGEPTQWQSNPFRPFCSERCKLIDLGAWANEEYRVNSEDTPDSLEASSSDHAEKHH